MKSLALALAVLCACAAAEAHAATDEERFLKRLKSYGIATSSDTKWKKPCLCVGGTHDGEVGALVVFKTTPSGPWKYECALPTFNDGAHVGVIECIAEGGSVVPISK